tara:strand:+ start:285 stop:1334 length:1050 start_codon:yes stop_codon:yes gene_type:complete
MKVMIMNTLWIDIKYANLLSAQLELFKVKKSNPYLANFRCPICGDSTKNKSKTRGYLLQHKTSLFMKCHNCSMSMGFSKFLQNTNSNLHSQYKVEKYKESDDRTIPEPDITKFTPPKFISNTILKKLKKISQLAYDHPAKLYVEQRKIPAKQHYKLFYCNKFNAFVNEHLSPGMFDEAAIKNDEPRLIIPFISKGGNLIAIQGRSFKKNSSLRYITIKLDNDAPLVYNMNNIDQTIPVYCVEGPIDSMFVPNSIAVAGADLKRVKEVLPSESMTYIFDNQPRNKEIVRIMERACDDGEKVMVWPDNIVEKDINDMILSGISEAQILDIINHNTYSSLILKMKINEWSKC